jgi:hypothetical protein
MPILSCFFVVGLILVGLLYCAEAVIVPSPVKFGGSQKLGLPASYKAPIVTFQKLTGTDAEAIGRRD